MVSFKVRALVLYCLQFMKVRFFQVIRVHLSDVHAYVDDTQLYSSFQSNSEVDQHEAVQAMKWCINSSGAWMKLDKLNETS